MFICDFLRMHGYPPSMREISEATFIATSTIRYHFYKLELEGLIETGLTAGGNMKARAIKVTELGRYWSAVWRLQAEKD